MKKKYFLPALLAVFFLNACGRSNFSPVAPSVINNQGISYKNQSWFSGGKTNPPPLNNLPVNTAINRSKLLVDREEIFPEIDRILAQAQKKIQVTTYLFGGKEGNDIARRLIEKKKEGVEIQFVADPSLGVLSELAEPARKEYNFLLQNGVEVRNFPVELLPKGPTFLSNQKVINHSKMVIVDEQTAVIGGMNFNSTEALNHDFMVRIDGPAAKQLSGIVSDNWQTSLPMRIKAQDSLTDLPEVPQIISSYNVQIAQTGFREQSIDDLLINSFNNARESIYLEMLMLDHHGIVEALVAAQKRGVEVKIILCEVEMGKYNKFVEKLPLDGISNFGAVTTLVENKVPVRWYVSRNKDELLHAKVATVDGQKMIIGSANYTYHALTRNHEVNVSIEDPLLTADFNNHFFQDWNNRSKEVKIGLKERLLGRAFRKFADLVYKNKSAEEIKKQIITEVSK